MTVVVPLAASSEKNEHPKARAIADRLSEELVIALVGPVGSGVSSAANILQEVLSAKYRYNVAPIIKPSDFIKAEAHRVGITPSLDGGLSQYISSMQDAGNALRGRFGNTYLAEKVVEAIVLHRNDNGGKAADGTIIPGRRAYIIDSLKNEEELILLRQIYQETICVIGIFAPDQMRSKRLAAKGIHEDDIKKITDRDQNEVATFGQKTRKLFVQADFFVCNDQIVDVLRVKIERYLALLFDSEVRTPTQAEAAMYAASASSAKSACMSRQVGASILSKTGELIGVGWNDVPKFQGGLYVEDDRAVHAAGRTVDKDNRCFKWGGCICHNEMRRKKIVSNIVSTIKKAGIIKAGKTDADILKLFEGTEIDALIEFSRSIHAEMEAILSVAREGKHSLVGATLYSTVYPCHNCARHIVAAGIAEVVYIEPYKKSLAIALHHDSVTEDPNERDKVIFRQYDGVSPQAYMKLFMPAAPRKRAGTVSRPDPATALPVLRMLLDAQVDYESKVIDDLGKKEHAAVAPGGG